MSSPSGWPGTTKSVENTPGSPTQPNCWKDASKIVPQQLGIPNLAVSWLSWSRRDFIGRWLRGADLSCWHFNLGPEIWLPLSGQPLNHVEAPKEELDLCCTFNCSHKPHNKPSCEAFKCSWTNRLVHFDNCRISVIIYKCTDKLMTLLNDLLILGEGGVVLNLRQQCFPWTSPFPVL